MIRDQKVHLYYQVNYFHVTQQYLERKNQNQKAVILVLKVIQLILILEKKVHIQINPVYH